MIYAVEEGIVTTPPLDSLNMIAPLVVAMAVAPAGVEGATTIVVGAGRTEAVRADEAASSLLREDSALRRLDATEDKLLSTEAMLLCAGLDDVVVLLARFASPMTSLLASRGFSECTCSRATRSLLKMPCWNLGARE